MLWCNVIQAVALSGASNGLEFSPSAAQGTCAMNGTTSQISSASGSRPLAISNWLWVVATMVVVIVVVGGITRLTESGLSITQWQLVTGILPPLSDAAWQAEFELYRQTAEYRYESGPAGMDLAAFKFIYFWEWFHRILGRAIGLAFAVPLAWFWLKGAIPLGYKVRLFALLALIGMQGAIGWYMVSSGVGTELTDVSHFRLSAHLLIALFLLGGLVWTALDLRALHRDAESRPAALTPLAVATALVLFVQLLLGAWVAGLNAGHASYDWPLMQGQLVPDFDRARGIGWALTHDPFLLHFLHRWWAWVAVIMLIWLARKVRRADRRASIAIHSAFGTQIILGIATVLTGVALWVAVAHQLVGALLVAATAWGMHVAGRKEQDL